jgi:hypothetical protein
MSDEAKIVTIDEKVIVNEELYIDIVFNDNPSAGGQFVEVQDNEGHTITGVISVVQRADFWWAMRINWDAIGEYYNERD